MAAIWIISYAIVAAAALAHWLLLFTQECEVYRFAHKRKRIAADKPAYEGRVALFVPCKGIDIGLEDNLRPLFRQTHPQYCIRFIVESKWDAACDIIQRLMDAHPHVEAQLIVAGMASNCGQKVHNLRAATKTLADNIDVLAFVDSDARPEADWLQLLLKRLNDPTAGATTSYRWLVPLRATMSNHLIYAINSSTAALYGPGRHFFIWGGSWAIRRETFEAAGLRDAWDGALSDDLVASRALKKIGLYAKFEPSCVVGSAVDYSSREMFAFLCRQYRIVRYYATRWWLAALILATLTNLALWGGITLSLIAAWNRSSWAWVPLLGSSMLYAVGVLRAAKRQRISTLYVPSEAEALAGAHRFERWGMPIVNLVNWMALVAAGLRRSVTWRDIHYRLGNGGRVEAVYHRCDEDPLPLPPFRPAHAPYFPFGRAEHMRHASGTARSAASQRPVAV